MVEGLNARSLVELERMNNLVPPGIALLLIGLFLPILIEEANEITGRFTVAALNVFNGTLSAIMFIGLTLLAYGVTYRRKGDVIMPLALAFLLLFSLDLFVWIYFVFIHWTSGPSGIFILPFAALGQIPFILTALFIFMVLVARFTYGRDPRKSGKPRYYR